MSQLGSSERSHVEPLQSRLMIPGGRWSPCEVGRVCGRTGGGATGEWVGTATLLPAPILPYIKSIMKRSQLGSLIHTSRL